MSARQFDRYMVAIGAARHVKFRRLSIAERHAFFLGVLPIAAQSPIRGCLLVGNLNAEPEDVAAEADVPVRVARNAMEKLRAVGVIVVDEEHNCECVHDFSDWNPAPKKDATNAERQRRYRARRNATNNATGNDAVTAGNAGEVEGESEADPPSPPQAGGTTAAELDEARERLRLVAPPRPKTKRQRDLEHWEAQFTEWASANFPGCPVKPLRDLVGFMPASVPATPEAVRRTIEQNPNFAHILEPAA